MAGTFLFFSASEIVVLGFLAMRFCIAIVALLVFVMYRHTVLFGTLRLGLLLCLVRWHVGYNVVGLTV